MTPVVAIRIVSSYFGLFAALLLAGRVVAAPINVVIDTSSFAGQTVDLAFDLTSSTANTVTLNPFTSDITQFGAITPSGDVSGSLTQLPLVLGGAPNFHEYLQTVTLGNLLAFTFTTTALPADPLGFPDDFAFFILIGGIPIDNGGPGGALLTYDFGIDSPVLMLFSSATLPVREGTPPSVPEPGELLLVAIALLALGAVVPRRKSIC